MSCSFAKAIIVLAQINSKLGLNPIQFTKTLLPNLKKIRTSK